MRKNEGQHLPTHPWGFKKVLDKKILTIIFVVLILFLGFYLRHYNYLIYPRHGATFDEYAWTWLGMNLIQEKVPMSWSPHPLYKDIKEIKYQGAGFLLVKPYLEHPPLFGLVAGSFAIVRGADDMYDVTLHKIRPLALLLGTFSIFMLFLLVHDLYGRKTAFIASLLYAVVPTVVIGSRLVQNENFFIPMWLASLFLVSKYIKTKKTWMRNVAALICGLLILAKIPWAGATLSVLLIFLYERKYKDIFKFISIVIPIALIYFVYGFYFDRETFIRIWQLQINRYDLFFDSIYALFLKPYLIDRLYIDGWIYFGWISAFILLLKDVRKNLILISGLLSYFIVFLTGIPDELSHGWYRYPFYPFLIAATAILIKDYFAKNWLITFMFVVFTGTALLHATWGAVFGFSYIVFRICIISWIIILLPHFLKNDKTILLARVTSFSWFLMLVAMSIWAVIIYIE